MLTTCPNCGTNFSVPDTALGRDGRKLKCAKCGHLWFQSPLRLEEDEPLGDAFDLAAVAPGPEPAPAPEPEAEPLPTFDLTPDPVPAGGRRPDLDFAPEPTFGRAAPQAELEEPPAGLMELGTRPVPDLFAPPADEPRHRGGIAALWALLALLVLGGLGGAAYYFQDPLVEAVPEAGTLLTSVGLRHEQLGAGLELRKAGSPERFVRNDTEVLRVCGLIVNVSDRLRPVPTMKLVLLDKAGQPVQEELARPPVSMLAPHPQGSVPFCILRDRPDPNAVEVVVVFSDQDAANAPVARPLDRAPARPAPAEAPAAPAPEGDSPSVPAAPSAPAGEAPPAPAPAPAPVQAPTPARPAP
ncbi:DUF3426 domain-containing protein [Phaeospirillum tilakii]|uniref:DUF3426 domain-containing protein n=1 Tax=Phaeospirillum tilakii TaxID=741673 RepID=A0ABW5CGU7_9PROT